MKLESIYSNLQRVKNQSFYLIGAMSGTSLDGIDLVYVRFSKTHFWNFEILASKTYSYSREWRKKLSGAIQLSDEELKRLDESYSLFLANHILNFIQSFNIDKLDAVGSHGHTVFHQPTKGLTLQIGNLELIADRIGKPVVCDFRTQDVAMGGEGAPLVPIGDLLLFQTYDACLNLGGFSNISIKKEGDIIAYDICAVNTVLNLLANRLNLPYDDRGKLARSGKIIDPLYRKLEELPHYLISPPKSLGIEWVNDNIVGLLKKYCDHSVIDLLHTYTIHVAGQIAQNLKGSKSVLVTGGGAFNDFLMSEIKNRSRGKIVIPGPDLINYKEALIFALLALLRLKGDVNCLASVTGARCDHSSGKIINPNSYYYYR